MDKNKTNKKVKKHKMIKKVKKNNNKTEVNKNNKEVDMIKKSKEVDKKEAEDKNHQGKDVSINCANPKRFIKN